MNNWKAVNTQANKLISAEKIDPAEIYLYLKENWYWIHPTLKVVWKFLKPKLNKLLTKRKEQKK